MLSSECVNVSVYVTRSLHTWNQVSNDISDVWPAAGSVSPVQSSQILVTAASGVKSRISGIVMLGYCVMATWRGMVEVVTSSHDIIHHITVSFPDIISYCMTLVLSVSPGSIGCHWFGVCVFGWVQRRVRFGVCRMCSLLKPLDSTWQSVTDSWHSYLFKLHMLQSDSSVYHQSKLISYLG